jgi:CRISPR-associated endonuclease Csn1
VKPGHDSILRYKLWEEQKAANNGVAVCIYTGKTISLENALNKDGITCEIEHILPYAKTHDDSISNKTLCFMQANRDKGNRSPFEAFGSSNEYPAILKRAERLPNSKRWRFEKDAMEKYADEGAIMERQLNDTRYISRVAREYLHYICKTVPESENKDVWTVNGALTALFRQLMGLNKILGDDGAKNRNDHRHHAVDAVAIGLISRGMIRKIHTLAGKSAEREKYSNIRRVLKDLPVPFPRIGEAEENKEAFFCIVKKSINSVIVSHKPDHGKEGELHEATAYGKLPDGKFFVYKRENGQRKISHPQANPTIPIYKKGETEPYKWFISGSNLYVDIVDIGKKCIIEGVSTFEANQKGFRDKWRNNYPEAKLLMRLYKSDIILHDGKYYVVAKLDPSNSRVICVHINDARKSEDRESLSKGLGVLSKEAKRVLVDLLGDVHIAKRNDE